MTNSWSEALVVPEGAKIEIRGPFTILATGPEPPKPEPEPRMFPQCLMPWLVEDQYAPWYAANNLGDAAQYWSWMIDPTLRDKMKPYMFEVHADAADGSGNYKRVWDHADHPEFIEAMQQHCDPNNRLLVGININCEIGRDSEWVKGLRVIAYIREHYPHVKLFTGPLWPGMEERYGMFDGLVAFANISRADRFPEDIGGYCRAITNYYGLPCSMSVQPVDSESGMYLAHPERFAQGMQILSEMYEGALLWKAEGLAQLAAGEIDSMTPSRFGPIMETIKNFKFAPKPRPKLKVKMVVLDYRGKAPANVFNQERMEARIIYRAGFEPVGSKDFLDDRKIWSQMELGDIDIFNRFHQWDHGRRDGTERERMIEIENEKAEWVKANYGGE